MKKYIFLIAYLLFVIVQSYSQEYFYTNLYKAKQKAKEENKRLFVDFSATWCGPCRMMETDIFPDPEVKATLTEKYVCVKLLQSKNKTIFKEYHIDRFPTFIIMKNDGKEIFRWSGYSIKERFLKRFDYIPLENNLVEKYDSLYFGKKKDTDFLRKYYVILNENKYYEKSKKISKKILKYDKNWLKKENMKLVLRNIDTKKYYKFLLKNKQTFYDSLSIDLVDLYLFANYQNENYNTDLKNDYVDIKKIKRTFIKIFHPKNVDKYFYNYLFDVLRDKTDTKQKQFYKVVALQYLQIEKDLMKSDEVYAQIENLLYKLKSVSEFVQMQKAFEFQFSGDPKSIYLPYYDLKAFVEYMLNENDKYLNTIKKANELSVGLKGKPFKTKLKEIIFAYKIVNKDITPETLD